MLVVVVLGMHKSGTTLVSELLHHSGVEMIEADYAITYDEGQHYERHSTSAINKTLLKALHLYSLETTTLLDLSTADSSVRAKAEKAVNELMRSRKDWGFKDPRTCLTYAFWKEILPDHKLVCVFRDAFEVYHRYRRKGRQGMQALHAWYVYNEAMLNAFEQAPEDRRLLLDYGTLMNCGGELGRLGRFVGRPIADRRDDRLRRSRPALDLRSRAANARYKLWTGNDVRRLNERLKQLAVETSAPPFDAAGARAP